MAAGVEVKIPPLGESVTEGVIVRWIKQDGEFVDVDEPLLELETDKASVEIPAERAGVVKVLRQKGETVQVGDVVAEIAPGAAPAKAAAAPQPTEAQPKAAPEAKPAPSRVSPLARRVASERGVNPADVHGTGSGGRVTRADVEAFTPAAPVAAAAARPASPVVAVAPAAASAAPARAVPSPARADGGDERVPMTPIRRRIAERLVQAQHTAAILTTFNEVDLTAILDLRRRYKERFQQVHGVGLGFMSFFARACVHALREIPQINAEIQGTDLVYHRHVHLGVAVSTERGLVVPVVRFADQLSFAEIETEIDRLSGRAREGKLSIDELSGGTFSITNGGVFGSLLSTPILNPPQSAILGMHKIEQRPMAVDGQVVIRPMMYVALSYDHRIIDGREAVTFLVRVKERLEDPSRMLLDV